MSETKSFRDQILVKAYYLIIELGESNFTMKTIADAFDLQAGSIYHYFASKEDLLTAMREELDNQLISKKLDIDKVASLPAEAALQSMFIPIDRVIPREESIKFMKLMFSEMSRSSSFQGLYFKMAHRVKETYLGVMDRLVEQGKLKPFDTESYAELFLINTLYNCHQLAQNRNDSLLPREQVLQVIITDIIKKFGQQQNHE